jgi:hypothetical protein
LRLDKAQPSNAQANKQINSFLSNNKSGKIKAWFRKQEQTTVSDADALAIMTEEMGVPAKLPPDIPLIFPPFQNCQSTQQKFAAAFGGGTASFEEGGNHRITTATTHATSHTGLHQQCDQPAIIIIDAYGCHERNRARQNGGRSG